MIFRRRFLLSIFLSALATATLPVATTPTLAAQTPSSAPAIAPPAHPVTLDQLRIYAKQTASLEPMRKLTLEAAEQQRKSLPAWFPSAVWDDIEQKMLSVDIPPVLLPVYQRYMSAETADALILFYSGPTGEQLAQHFTAREADSASKGTSGAATSSAAINGMLNSGADLDLAAKRMKELSPEDQARVLAAKQAVGDSWKAASDELALVYDNYMNDFIQAQVRNHNSELVAAKVAYLRKNPASH